MPRASQYTSDNKFVNSLCYCTVDQVLINTDRYIHNFYKYSKVHGTLLGHDNRCDGISNHLPHDCSLNRSFRRRSKHQSSMSLAFVQGIHRSPVNSLHKRPVTWKMFPFDDVIMEWRTRRIPLTHHPLEKMAAISQTIFSDAFSCMKSFVFCLKFHWNLFLKVQLTITQYWFR